MLHALAGRARRGRRGADGVIASDVIEALAAVRGVSARAPAPRVNLAAIERNTALLARARPRLCAVVKADGYGHGARPLRARGACGRRARLAVATAHEAASCGQAGVEAPILVLGRSRSRARCRARGGAELVAWSEEFLGWWPRAAAPRPRQARQRHGAARDARCGARRAGGVAGSERPPLELAGAMTHLATADEPDASFLRAQLERFGSGWRRCANGTRAPPAR